jgi:hypothetical protein
MGSRRSGSASGGTSQTRRDLLGAEDTWLETSATAGRGVRQSSRRRADGPHLREPGGPGGKPIRWLPPMTFERPSVAWR